ncbi:MAG: cobalt transport protein CbiN [Thermoplasmata archaeon]|nr:cobalt transport protein CbiN [Thermoplasmata archaeon]
MNAKNAAVYIGGFAVIALLCVVALAYGAGNGSEFGGADDGAEGVIGEYDPDYEPWYSGIFGDYELPGETESMLFALQAAIGAVIIGYFIGHYTIKKE